MEVCPHSATFARAPRPPSAKVQSLLGMSSSSVPTCIKRVMTMPPSTSWFHRSATGIVNSWWVLISLSSWSMKREPRNPALNWLRLCRSSCLSDSLAQLYRSFWHKAKLNHANMQIKLSSDARAWSTLEPQESNNCTVPAMSVCSVQFKLLGNSKTAEPQCIIRKYMGSFRRNPNSLA